MAQGDGPWFYRLKRWLKFFDYIYLIRVKGLKNRDAVDQATVLRGFLIMLCSLRVGVKIKFTVGTKLPGS